MYSVCMALCVMKIKARAVKEQSSMLGKEFVLGMPFFFYLNLLCFVLRCNAIFFHFIFCRTIL